MCMKHFYFSIFVFLFATISAFADGTKQLMPPQENGTAKGVCYISIGQAQSVSFGRYHGSESASEQDRIYIRIIDATNEEIHFGVGDKIFKDQSNSTIKISNIATLNYRIMKPDGTVAKTGSLKDGNHITSYSQAINGPKTATDGHNINSNGYNSISYKPTSTADTGNYWIEFDIGTPINSNSLIIDFEYFDITVINNQTYEPINGRVWAYEWGLSPTGYPSGFENEVWSTFYTRSNDKYTSKVYFAGAKPYRFILGCNSFGATDEFPTAEENRQSYPNRNTFKPEYRIFLTRPNDDEWGGAANPPNVPEQLALAGDALSCEDLIFVVQLLNTEDATVELYIDGEENGEGVDKILVERMDASKSNKGYHYPWKDNPHITNAGTHWYTPSTITSACPRLYKLSLFDQRFKLNSDETYNYGDTIKIEEISSDDVNYGAYSKGLGTANNPIILDSKADLIELQKAIEERRDFQYIMDDFYINSNKEKKSITKYIPGGENGFEGVHFYLTAPSGTIELDDDWEPIGTATNPFKGTFQGGNYNPNPTIETDKVPASDQDTITLIGVKGLFAYCEDATIENIHVKGDNILITQSNINEESFGTICNYAKNTKFSHCTSFTNLRTSETNQDVEYVGGILGYGINCTLDSCSNYGKIETTNTYATGGIAGAIENSKINFCYNLNYIKNDFASGGIIGLINGENASTITNCRNDGTIDATDYCYDETNECDDYGSAGGIVGRTYAAFSIDGCSNSCLVSGYKCGSIIGDEDSDITGSVSHCYNNSKTINFSLRCSEITYSINDIEGTISYITTDGCNSTQDTPDLEQMGTTSKGTYYFDKDFDNNIVLVNTYCCGKIWRTETAGRLFSDDKSYYMAWDGKDDNGNCITGKIDVSYHKNSGVTHFPFYDPENIQLGNGLQGMVVYRISPIKKNETTISLPLNYYQTQNTSEEQGYELNLFWDDRKISFDTECSFEKKTIKGTEYNYGKNVREEITETKEYCTNVTGCKSKLENYVKTFYACTNPVSGKFIEKEDETFEPAEIWQGTGISFELTTTTDVIKTDSNGKPILDKRGRYQYEKKTEKLTYYEAYTGECADNCLRTTTKTYSYCANKGFWYSNGGECIQKQIVTQAKEVSCQGITNIDEGGYLGSIAGGHIFPYENLSYDNKGFGNSNTMNTWWNGVETVGKSTLILKEDEPAILMPIVISKWIATNQTNSVLLEWRTSSENNNDYFTIERSYDGVHWTKIGKISGAGTTSISHNYSFVDYEPLDGISYYRIKQTDFNGEYSYSSIKCINRIAENKNAFKAYTKKNSNEFIVEGKEIAACTIELYDTMGRKVTNVSYTTVDTDKVVISVNKLNAGTYIIKSCNQAKTIVKNW